MKVYQIHKIIEDDNNNYYCGTYLHKETAEKELNNLIETAREEKANYTKCQNCPINKDYTIEDLEKSKTDADILAEKQCRVNDACKYCQKCAAHIDENYYLSCDNEIYDIDDVYYFIEELTVTED